MSARACLEEAIRLGDHYQLAINDFMDEFRRASREARETMIRDALGSSEASGLHARKLAALIAAVTSALAHEANLVAPPWTALHVSPEPFFVLPARTFAMRVRLMLESPPPFRNRRVFVPETYLERA